MFWIIFDTYGGPQPQPTLWRTTQGGYEFAEFMAKVLNGTNLGGDISVNWENLDGDNPLV
jgi:hypothetical protein